MLKRVGSSLIIFMLLWVTVAVAITYHPQSGSAQEIRREYLVSFKSGIDSGPVLKKKKINQSTKMKLTKQNTIVVELTDSEVLTLKQETDVRFIEPNNKVQKASTESGSIESQFDSYEAYPWGLVAIGSDLQPKQDTKGQSVKVAVLDTGIADHPDLMLQGGVSFVSGVTSYSDDNGHGTHVAGTIAAKQNDIGIIGVAPQVDLYSVKVLDSTGSGTYAQVIQGIEWCIENGIQIISMSFTGTSNSEALHQVIQQADNAGIVLVAAAGNQGSGTNTMMYPALFPEVVSVGATTQANIRANLSSTGQELDIVAPGVDILSTTKEGGYGLMSGTSMAVPHVTGAAAVVWSQNRQLTAEEVTQVLYDNTTVLGDPNEYGHGLVNLAKSIQLIDGVLPTVDSGVTDPTLPGSGGDGEVNISASERGQSFNTTVTVPAPPSGSSWQRAFSGFNYPDGTRKTTLEKSGPFTTGQSLTFTFSTSLGDPLGAYSVIFTFCTSVCSGSGSTTIGPWTNTVYPEAPSSISVTSTTTNSISVSWASVSGVSQYEVSGPGFTSRTVSGTSTTITGLSPGTSYTISVRCSSPSGQSSRSTTASTQSLSAPSGLKAYLVSSENIMLEWQAVSGASSYKVTDSASYYTRTVTTTYTSYSGLTPGQTYQFWVESVPNGNTSTITLTTDSGGSLPSSVPITIDGTTYYIKPY